MARTTRPAPKRADANRKPGKGAAGAAGKAKAPAARSEARSSRIEGRPARAEAKAPRSAAGPSRPRATSSPSEGRTSRPAGRPLGARAPRPEAAPRKVTPRPKSSSAVLGLERLQKILAHAGVASRRACEEMILEGRVQVNGVTVTELGAKADPRRDSITLDLQPIQKEAPVYILVNKPKGYVTTVRDEQGRPTVMALLSGVEARVYPVGRLDFNSEGLLLMTNDGEMAQRLASPENHIPKVYLVKVHRMLRPETLDEMREGFRLDGRRLKPCGIELYDKQDNPWLKVTLIEGKNQQIRKMFAAVGHPVHKLRRIQFGPLDDPFLKPGEWRFLNPQELAALKNL